MDHGLISLIQYDIDSSTLPRCKSTKSSSVFVTSRATSPYCPAFGRWTCLQQAAATTPLSSIQSSTVAVARALAVFYCPPCMIESGE